MHSEAELAFVVSESAGGTLQLTVDSNIPSERWLSPPSGCWYNFWKHLATESELRVFCCAFVCWGHFAVHGWWMRSVCRVPPAVESLQGRCDYWAGLWWGAASHRRCHGHTGSNVCGTSDTSASFHYNNNGNEMDRGSLECVCGHSPARQVCRAGEAMPRRPACSGCTGLGQTLLLVWQAHREIISYIVLYIIFYIFLGILK